MAAVADVAEPETRACTESDVERWRGTPELFAHLARVVEAVASEDEPAPASLTIDLEVEEDHEVFNDADAFVTAVTPEGLRSFETISVTACGTSRTASITFRWKRRWWQWGWGPDAEVIIELVGDAAWRARARPPIDNALARGHGRMGSGTAGGIAAASAGNALVIIWLSLVELFSVEIDDTALFGAAAGWWLVGTVIGAYFGTWAIPSLEIAPLGQTRVTRVVKWVGSVVLAIGLAGLSKALFG